ncbi:hypothetical protein Aab01nite_61080 [Paractinoplanes abujensis]|uniref:Golgi phosphoprotein 3 GPP34 n=1 Tax=Paractinoplanes abujensis TaxID=882441 RepID=A0A7W7G0D1_9ACTN|nr:GPP34 family phosphoprotein [Actinoplanes abujensis]MBB4692978.1 hypothetical protein [Actinoplanes abujensis]GID22518.1 hypothetical protein Aab01nite_61080 [Actinoplanes abujensis]
MAPRNPNPTVAEDLLLLLFQPGSGTIAGENTLFYVLGGAVLADLALGEHVRTETGRMGSALVVAVEERPPADDLLRAGWDYVRPKPRGVQTVLAAIGPTLRGPVIDRLVERGDLSRSSRKTLGIFNTTALEEGPTERRAGLLDDVRAVLADGADPDPRTAALAALISGSGTLPQFDPVIPWTSPTITRAKELEQGNWGAGAAAEAVTRTVTATIINSVIVATTVLPQQ